MQSLPSWPYGFHLQFVHLVGRFWVFFLSHTAPGFQLWFYFHLYMLVIYWGLLLRLPWRTWVCPMRTRCGGGEAAWVAGVLAAPGTQGGWWLAQQEVQCSRSIWQTVMANMLQYSCLENPLTEKPGRLQSTGSQSVRHDRSDPACIDARLPFLLVEVPQWELSMKVAQLLGLWGPWWNQVCRDMDCFRCRNYGLSVFFSILLKLVIRKPLASLSP